MSHCTSLAVSLCSSAARERGSSASSASSNVARNLSPALEVFFALLEDPEADVRILADESLNRVVRALADGHAGRLQVGRIKVFGDSIS